MVDSTAVPKRKKPASRKAAAPRVTKIVGLEGALSKLEQLDAISGQIKSLDLKIGGLAVLIIVAPLVHKFLA